MFEPVPHAYAFVLQSGLDVVAVRIAFGRDGLEGLSELDPLIGSHEIHDRVVISYISVVVRGVHRNMGADVSTTADGCTGGLDLDIHAVATNPEGNMIGLFDLARESEANDLLGVLSTVGIGAGDSVVQADGLHGVSFRSACRAVRSYLDYTSIIAL